MNNRNNPVLILANPAAGGGRGDKTIVWLEEYLGSLDVSYRLLLTEPDLGRLPLKKHELQEYSSLWVLGGDGTIHKVINHFGIPEMPVALISAGSGNDFSRSVLGTLDIREQIRIALHGVPGSLDLGRCNGKYFLTGVGIGFDGLVARRVNKLKAFIGGSSAYYFTVLLNLLLYREKKMKIRISGHDEQTSRRFMATIGNTAIFGGGFRVTPFADPRDGLLDLNLVNAVGRLSRLLHLDKVRKGEHTRLPFVEYIKGTKFRIESDVVIPCHMDGEVYAWSYFDVTVVPNALKLLQAR